ncbi:unnamed protein product, partial [Meganyctiphanes norvegica]
MDNMPSWAQLQYLQQIANYQQILLGHYLASGGNSSSLFPAYDISHDDNPEAKRRRLECNESVEGSSTSSTRSTGGIAPPTPSPSCSSGSIEDGHDLGASKGRFHELLLSPSKVKTEEPQFESPLKVVELHHPYKYENDDYPEVLDLSCKPSRREEPVAPMVMLPRSSLELFSDHPRYNNHHEENRYHEAPSAPTKAP